MRRKCHHVSEWRIHRNRLRKIKLNKSWNSIYTGRNELFHTLQKRPTHKSQWRLLTQIVTKSLLLLLYFSFFFFLFLSFTDVFVSRHNTWFIALYFGHRIVRVLNIPRFPTELGRWITLYRWHVKMCPTSDRKKSKFSLQPILAIAAKYHIPTTHMSYW